LLHDHVSGGAEVGAGTALRSRRHRRRQLVAAHLVCDAADDAQHHRDHDAVLADRHLCELRHRAHPDRGRPARSHPHLRDLGIPRRYRGQRHPAWRQRLAVHGADPCDRSDLHPARCQQTRERSLMTTVTIDKAGPTRKVKYRSMTRDRVWALRWSYFFLTLFAIFALVPPIYMLITSLKTSAEISAAT